MHLHAFTEEMEIFAPPALAEEFDAGRIGLVVEGRPEIGTICCALDATPAVVRQVVASGADMLVVHHTPIWTPLTALTGRTAILMKEILSAGLNVYVMHTNFDHAAGGVNDALCELLGLSDCEPMTLGAIGTCALPLSGIAERIGGNLRIWGNLSASRRLAIVAGSGFDPEYLSEAHARGRCVSLCRNETFGSPGGAASLHRVDPLRARGAGHETPCGTARLAVY